MGETRYVGEVGLDAGARLYKSLDAQKHVFRRVLERCADAGKILTAHSVRSVPAVLELIERYLPQHRGVVVLHWLTGSKTEARRAVALGCYFSVNAEITRSDRGRALVTESPIDRILTETDGRFTQIDGRPSEPADVKTTIAAIAGVRELPAARWGADASSTISGANIVAMLFGSASCPCRKRRRQS
jgi:TatD DNase family protein